MALQKIVMSYSEGDGCTYSCQNDVPFWYESTEQALVDFENLIKSGGEEFKFAGMDFYRFTFVELSECGKEYVNLPNFYTMDEWFTARCANRTFIQN